MLILLYSSSFSQVLLLFHGWVIYFLHSLKKTKPPLILNLYISIRLLFFWILYLWFFTFSEGSWSSLCFFLDFFLLFVWYIFRHSWLLLFLFYLFLRGIIDRRNGKVFLINTIRLPPLLIFLILYSWPIFLPSIKMYPHRPLLLFLLLGFRIIHILLKLLINSDHSIIRITIIPIDALIILRRRWHLHIPIPNHRLTQRLQQLQKILQMSRHTLCNSLPWYMIKVIFNQFSY